MSCVTITAVRPEPPADLQELAAQFVARHRVEGAERLVQQHHLRPRRQRAREADALLLTAGQLRRQTAAILRRRQVDHVEQLIDALLDPLGRPAEELRHHGDVFGDGQVREQADALEDVADAAAQLDRIGGARRPAR